jgi:prolyl-tRNA synthetase
MLRAGLIKRAAAGIYTWMPLGLRVLKKVETIIREEMNRAGAIELSMPAVQPAELWQESGRWEKYGPELLRFKDRNARDFVIGPTHEEVITDVVRRDVKSYRQLPLCLYQIQAKFRDEIRPRFGVMRGREFLMKDGYSFHTNLADLEREYQAMFDAYTRIFSRLGLQFRAVAADTGAIGGSGSHEFHVIAETGEDDIAYCPDSSYAANVELAAALPPAPPAPHPKPGARALAKVATPGKTACADVASFLGIAPAQLVKAIAIVGKEAADNSLTLLLLRGDHILNEVKAAKVANLGDFRFASDVEITAALGCPPGYIGAVGILPDRVRVIADHAVAAMTDFVCGANEAGFHLAHVHFGRDLPMPKIADIRNVVEGDPSPDGQGRLALCRGIEVGHIFQLRTRYSEAMNCRYLDEQGKSQVMEMGCYGIGVSRIVGATIEQNHDEKGIVFPVALAPFAVAIVPMGYHKSSVVREAADRLYDTLLAAGIDVLLDDRDERPGSLFADMDLIGVPHRLVVGERSLKNGEIEYKGRRDTDARLLPVGTVLSFIQDQLQ